MIMADDVFLLDSPAIEKAVMAHNTEVTRRRRFGKSSLNEIPEVSGGSSEYNGYFKIIAVPVVDEGQPDLLRINVSILDGGGSKVNYCYVNNSLFSVPDFNTQLLANKLDTEVFHHFYLKYDNETDSVSIEEDTPDLRPAQSVQLGRVCVREGNVTVYQDNYGMPRLLWFAECDEGEQ